MRTIEQKIYTFDELDDKAKRKARDWYRQGNMNDTFWSECVLDEVPHLLALCGITIATKTTKLMGGGTGREPVICWSGFSSQGDGACFEASWTPETLDVANLKDECPATYKDAQGVEQVCKGNAELHAIADESTRLAALDPHITWRCTPSGRYYNEQATTFDHYDERGEDEEYAESIQEIEDAHEENARDAMRWIYHQLEREYEYQNSDEQVDESIRANEYEFEENGARA